VPFANGSKEHCSQQQQATTARNSQIQARSKQTETKPQASKNNNSEEGRAFPPARAIATLLSALFQARDHSAAAAFSFAPALPLRVSSTSGAIPPACAIATWLSAFMAR